MDLAAAAGHLEVVKWLHTNTQSGCSSNAMDDAAANGHFKVVKWLHANAKRSWLESNKCTDRAFVSAACNGHFEVMKWVSSHCGHQRQWKVALADETASCGRLDALQWLQNNGYYVTKRAMDAAATNGHLEVVTWLHHHTYKEGCTTAAMNGAARYGHLAVVEWLHDNRREGCTTEAMDGAAGDGRLNVVCWHHEHRAEGCTGKTIKRAAWNGHSEVVRWLNKTYGKQFSILDLIKSAELAARGGHLKVVQAWRRTVGSPVTVTAFMYGKVPIVEWLLDRGYQLHGKDTNWAQKFWNSYTYVSTDLELVTTQIVYKGVELSIPDVRHNLVEQGHLRMIRWLWYHGCKTTSCTAGWTTRSVVTRWLVENGAQMDRGKSWDMFWTHDCLEVVEWVPVSDRVWIVRKALKEDERGLEKVMWVLENVNFVMKTRAALSEISSTKLQVIVSNRLTLIYRIRKSEPGVSVLMMKKCKLDHPSDSVPVKRLFIVTFFFKKSVVKVCSEKSVWAFLLSYSEPWLFSVQAVPEFVSLQLLEKIRTR